MSDRKRILILIFIMISISFIISATTIFLLYRSALEENRKRLMDYLKVERSIYESLDDSDYTIYKKDLTEKVKQSALMQFIKIHRSYKHSHDSLEITIAKKENNKIKFLLGHIHFNLEHIQTPIPFGSPLAVPMQMALSKNTGSMIGLDYHGIKVLSAYSPIKGTNLGIVVKIHLHDIRAPFLKAALTAFFIAIGLILAGSLLFIRIANPMVKQLLKLKNHLENLVKEQTQDLQNTNTQLKEEIFKRNKIEKEMILQSEITANMAEGVNLVRKSDGSIVYINAVFDKMFGYNPNELLGKHVSVLNAPSEKQPENIANEIFEALKTDGSWSGELLNIRKDGTHFWCHASVSIFEHPEFGEVCISVHTDISKRKKADLALRESEEKFRRLFETSNDAILVMDREAFQFEEINNAGLKLFGYSREEFLNLHPGDIFRDPINIKNTYNGVKKEINCGGVFFNCYKKKNGSLFPGEKSPGSFLSKGRLKNFSIIRDMSKYHEAYEKVSEQEKFLKEIIESLAHPFYVINITDHSVNMMNSEGKKWLSSVKSTCYGMTNGKKHPCKERKDSCPLELILKTKKPVTVVKSVKNKNSSAQYFNIHFYPIFNKEKNVEQVIEYVEDITEQMENQEKLKINQSRLRRGQQIAQLGFFEYSPLLKEEYLSDEIYAILGYKSKTDKLNFEGFLNHFQDSDKKKLQQIINIKEEDNFSEINFELKARSKDNRDLNFNVKIDVEKDEKQKIFKIVGIIQDITQKKIMEKAILVAIDKERNRISRDLHDGLGQKLTAISYMVGSFKSNLKNNTIPTPEELDKVLDWLEEVTSDSQAISKGLFSLEKKYNNLIPLLEEMANNIEKSFKVNCLLKTEGTITLNNSESFSHIYFIINEAINNAIKHGKAKKILISLNSNNGTLNIEIKDDGIGMVDLSNLNDASKGLGIKTMKYRANLMGADFSARNDAEKGFIVNIIFRK